MDVMFDRVAGLDIGKASVTVCVRTPGEKGRRKSETRTFRTMTRSLVVMADWLCECGVELAAMEFWAKIIMLVELRVHLKISMLAARPWLPKEV